MIRAQAMLDIRNFQTKHRFKNFHRKPGKQLQLQEVRHKYTRQLEQVNVEVNSAKKVKLALEKSKQQLEMSIL